MTSGTRQILFISLAVMLAAVIMLAVSLSDVQLGAGSAFPGRAEGQSSSPAVEAFPQPDASPLPLPGVILTAALLAVLIYLPARLAGLVSLRNLIWIVAGTAFLVVLLSMLPRIAGGTPRALVDESAAPAVPGHAPPPVTPLGAPPRSFLWIAGGALMIGLGLIGVSSWRRLSGSGRTAEAVSVEAENALRALQGGGDFSNVVIRFYLQMMELLRRERGWERAENMTVREFEDWLRSNGVPAEPVQHITLLFEKARYSREQISEGDERAGAECLREIVRHFHQKGGERR